MATDQYTDLHMSVTPLPLRGLRVIDVAGRAAPHCAQLLALFGADVVVVDSPDNDTAAPDWFAFNLLKRRVALDLRSAAGRDAFDALAESADVIIEADSPIPGFTPRSTNPAAIHVVVSAFGGSGPRASWKSSELVAQAAGGLLLLSGNRDHPPAQVGMPIARAMTGAQAACSVMLALAHRNRTGEGSAIDVSAQESVANLLFTTQFMSYISKQPGGRGEQPLTVEGREVRRRVLWECADGFATWNLWTGPGMGSKNAAMFEWMTERGVPEAESLLALPWERMSTGDLTDELTETVHTSVDRFFRTLTKDEIRREASTRRIMLYPVDSPADVLINPQLRAREVFRSVDVAGRSVEIVSSPMRSTAYAVDLLQNGPTADADPAEVAATWRRSTPKPTRSAEAPGLPLAGVRVLDLGWAVVSPLTTRFLAMFGADVVKLEYRRRPDPTRMTGPYPLGRPSLDGSAPFVSVNSGKRSMGVDLNNPDARNLVLRLAAKADVVSENFAPGVADRMGYGYEVLKSIRPDIIAMSLSMQGQTGPSASQPGLGNHLQAMSGIDFLTGFPDGAPGGPNQVMPDFIGPWLPIVSILAALEHRRLTGEGQYLDISQFEAMFLYLQPQLIGHQLGDPSVQRLGNRSLTAAPHGVYPLAGEDRWVAIAVQSDREWERLHALLPTDARERFSAALPLSERLAVVDELDRAIAAWTSNHDGEALVQQLQDLDIAASIVNDGLDLLADPQLSHRRHYRHVDHSRLGDQIVDAPSFRVDSFEPRIEPGPTYADDTVSILDDWLALDSDELSELIVLGALDL